MMQNVGIHFQIVMPNHGTQHETRQLNPPITKQMHYKFKLEKTKNNVFLKF
jgi:hypothetical protein